MGRFIDQLIARLGHAEPGITASGALVLVVIGLVLVLTPVWSATRLFVTLVHELGHALVGMAVGRQFTGFVLRSDASGHAITRGKPRGPGLVLTAWAGYPAPAVVGSAVLWFALAGWSAAVLAVAVLIGLLALVRVRSGLTLLVTLAALLGSAALLWFGTPLVRGGVVALVGVVLVIGAWRHLALVAPKPRGVDHSDPGMLARATKVPRLLWLASFAVVILGCPALVAWLVLR